MFKCMKILTNCMKKINFLLLIGAVVVCLLAGMIGSFFTTPAITSWYSGINKPDFNPPNWIFGPVWTALYILMGISLYLVLEKGIKKKGVKLAVSVFGIQLALNSVWSILFFGLGSPFLAFIEILFLWGAIAATMYLFYKINKNAAYLLIPYICWVSFAAFLNYSIWIIN